MEHRDSTKAAWLKSATLLLLGLTFVFVWYTRDVLLLVFAAVLLALILRGMSHNRISTRTSLSEKWSVVVMLILVLSLLSLAGWLAGDLLATQLDQLTQEFPAALDRFKQWMDQKGWGLWILDQAAQSREFVSTTPKLLPQATSVVSSVFGVLGSFIVWVVLGVYFTVSPTSYIKPLIRLFPPDQRSKVEETVRAVAQTLRWWLTGKMISMVLIGVLTAVGLKILGIPLFLILGVLAAILTFIPNLGPILSAVPAVLFGWAQGPHTAAYVALLYLGIQFSETYFITPIIQQKTISLPPPFTLILQIVFGIFAGLLGVALATPLGAAGVVLIRELYMGLYT